MYIRGPAGTTSAKYKFHDTYVTVRKRPRDFQKTECRTLPPNSGVADIITACTGWSTHSTCMEEGQGGDMVSQFGTILERMPSPLHWGPGKGVNMGQSPTAAGMAG